MNWSIISAKRSPKIGIMDYFTLCLQWFLITGVSDLPYQAFLMIILGRME